MSTSKKKYFKINDLNKSRFMSLSQVKIAVDLGYQGIKWVDEVIFQVAGLWNLKIRC